jgi:hypothetical protein
MPHRDYTPTVEQETIPLLLALALCTTTVAGALVLGVVFPDLGTEMMSVGLELLAMSSAAALTLGALAILGGVQ